MWEAALISAGANLLGSHMRNKEARKASAKQMAFQEDMSNTSYQRGMEDMKKAGLNPILAGKMGGASTPSGSTYNPENVATNATNAYLQTKQNEANVKLTEAQTAKVEAETGVISNTDNSGIGKAIEYGLKKLQQAYKGISQSEAIKTIENEYSRIFANSGKQFEEIQQLIKQKANELFKNSEDYIRIHMPVGDKIKRTKKQ